MFLVMISEQQLEWLKLYSHRGIVIDDSHHTSQYNFKLTTLIVLDKADRGLPAGLN